MVETGHDLAEEPGDPAKVGLSGYRTYSKPETGWEMKATVILIGVLLAAAGVGAIALEPAWMMASGALLIALGSAVRRYVPEP